MRRWLGAVLVAGVAAGPVAAANVHICWLGQNGYSMTGYMEFPDELLDAELITEEDVTVFRIAGYLDGELLGEWDKDTRRPDATWYLRYFPERMHFPTNGEILGPFDQGWNADGTAEDCAEGEFGFNAGNYAQDFCLSGVWVEPSGVLPETPFHAQNYPINDVTCRIPALLSKRRG